MSEKKLFKLVITGGPCAGKTSAMEILRCVFEDRGYSVVVIPETATEFICSGIAPWTMDSSVNYQKYQLRFQLEKERLYCEAAEHLAGHKKLMMLIDRGAMDNKAYLSDSDFNGILDDLELREDDILSRYDAVFHMETNAANGIGYTLSNNSARTETSEEALRLDGRTLSVWHNHPYHRVIKCTDTLEEKANALANEILTFLNR